MPAPPSFLYLPFAFHPNPDRALGFNLDTTLNLDLVPIMRLIPGEALNVGLSWTDTGQSPREIMPHFRSGLRDQF
ncbi:hypothetical protein EVAR_68227_1 [Eumeta japonica]|uniref:Uncharacterized protein n=1 Tax=Eumeta variegata TaxID=151549 RepID=A0A4C1ZPA4_EUMVA|nr:hypothetical protein EVAR_68227_1 [Eumeta japonica]